MNTVLSLPRTTVTAQQQACPIPYTLCSVPWSPLNRVIASVELSKAEIMSVILDTLSSTEMILEYHQNPGVMGQAVGGINLIPYTWA